MLTMQRWLCNKTTCSSSGNTCRISLATEILPGVLASAEVGVLALKEAKRFPTLGVASSSSELLGLALSINAPSMVVFPAFPPGVPPLGCKGVAEVDEPWLLPMQDKSLDTLNKQNFLPC